MKYDYGGLCLIEIGGGSCAGCIAVMPHCRKIAQDNDLKFIKLSLEEDGEDVARFAPSKIPAIILADGGVPFARCFGYQPQEILAIWVEAKLAEHTED